MSEINQSPSSNPEENLRPIGRFLLGQTTKSNGRIYNYALSFANEYKDIINPAWSASVITKQEIDGVDVSLEFGADIVGEGFYSWRLHADREQYDIHSNQDGYTSATYYEFTNQRSVLRRKEIGSRALLAHVQESIETMTMSEAFEEHAAKLRTDWWELQIEIAQLELQEARTFKENNDLKSLRSQLFISGFPVGSINIGSKKPLLNPPDWNPVVIDDKAV
ncbi:MAG: hypothetical protein JWN75_713 [Candidatus Saccharibacteria bacterium]|nr:hypothetical protein [Candidatus Saccharibacteria bacterium]